MTQVMPLSRPTLGQEEADAVAQVLESGWLVQGTKVAEFETNLAHMTGFRHAVAVSSGTAALHVAFSAVNVSPGDAVFIPSFAWPSAANVATAMGAHVVFVDVNPDTYNINVADLVAKIRSTRIMLGLRPRLIVPVHQFGLPADMSAVQDVAEEFGLDVIADGACALGAGSAEVGLADGAAACILSFHPRKSITTGEGGAVLTDDPRIAGACRSWRNHGQLDSDRTRDFVAPGLNYRMTEMAAAIGLVQLRRFPEILATRKRIARRYCHALADLAGWRVPAPAPEHAFQTFMVVPRLGEGSRLISALQSMAIGAGAASVSGHDQRYYREVYGYRPADLPVSHRLGKDGVALPLFASLTDAEVDRVIDATTHFASNRKPAY